jgi:hypothetical protein
LIGENHLNENKIYRLYLIKNRIRIWILDHI